MQACIYAIRPEYTCPMERIDGEARVRNYLLMAAGALALAGCSNGLGHGVALGPSQEKIVRLAPHFARRPYEGAITVRTPNATLHLTVAADARSLTRGLGGRHSLARHTGMLFVAPWPGDHLLTMWMKDTYVPIDMVFINAADEVTGVARDVPAGARNAPDFRIARRFGHGHYVIELPAFEAMRDGITTGTHLSIPHAIATL